jgi:hypothetical protein
MISRARITTWWWSDLDIRLSKVKKHLEELCEAIRARCRRELTEIEKPAHANWRLYASRMLGAVACAEREVEPQCEGL